MPTSAWGTNYVAASAYEQIGGSMPPIQLGQGPSYNIIAKEDDTHVTLKPKANLNAGGGMVAGPANQPYQITLMKGQHAQFTQTNAPLSGTPIDSDKPIGVFGGHQIMSIDQCCGDHGEQMLAPVRALGSEYVAAAHPERHPGEVRIFRIYGAVPGTALTYDPPNVGPATVSLGEILEIRTAQPFTVRSQDAAHPFTMFTYMSGAGEQGAGGIGDPDFVRLVPPLQYMQHYVFFTDPTYPFTNLTVVRKRTAQGFAEVELGCMGNITGWQPVGSDGQFEITWVKMVDHWNGMNGCNNGVNTMTSQGTFGVWVWGWGSEDTNTGWVSYGYPAGENVQPINDVVVY
ncbi:MAG: IgGFc-binding protein [Proteobacteria bacterium]|nr:IgGFc-binding protein [Pseudomonadota bacterium]